MKYCGVVTDRSWHECNKLEIVRMYYLTGESYKEITGSYAKGGPRIYSDEVPMADESVIQTIKDKSCRMVDFGMNFREAYRR